MAVTFVTRSWDVRALGANAGWDSSMKQCHYCHKWGHVKSSCYRLLKVCFACHRQGHYVANCVWRSWPQSHFAGVCSVRRQRFWGINNRARKRWKYHRDGPWVGPTTPRQYRGTVEQGNSVRWLREHLFGAHEDHPGFDVALAQSVPPGGAELPAEMPTALLVVKGRSTEGMGVVRTNELELGVSIQKGPNELDIADSVELPAVISSDVVKMWKNLLVHQWSQVCVRSMSCLSLVQIVLLCVLFREWNSVGAYTGAGRVILER